MIEQETDWSPDDGDYNYKDCAWIVFAFFGGLALLMLCVGLAEWLEHH